MRLNLLMMMVRLTKIISVILLNIQKHEPHLIVDYENLNERFLIELDKEKSSAVFPIINLVLLYLKDNNGTIEYNATTAATIDYSLLEDGEFYRFCSQFSEGQQHLFSFILVCSMRSCLAGKCNDPFYIFSSGGAGVGKSLLVNAITDYTKRILKYPAQNLFLCQIQLLRLQKLLMKPLCILLFNDL